MLASAYSGFMLEDTPIRERIGISNLVLAAIGAVIFAVWNSRNNPSFSCGDPGLTFEEQLVYDPCIEEQNRESFDPR